MEHSFFFKFVYSFQKEKNVRLLKYWFGEVGRADNFSYIKMNICSLWYLKSVLLSFPATVLNTRQHNWELTLYLSCRVNDYEILNISFLNETNIWWFVLYLRPIERDTHWLYHCIIIVSLVFGSLCPGENYFLFGICLYPWTSCILFPTLSYRWVIMYSDMTPHC